MPRASCTASSRRTSRCWARRGPPGRALHGQGPDDRQLHRHQAATRADPAGVQPRHPGRHAQAAVDVRAARQGQAERRQPSRPRCTAWPAPPWPPTASTRPPCPASAPPCGQHGRDRERRVALPGRRRAARAVDRARHQRRPGGPALDAALWQWSEVRSGIVTADHAGHRRLRAADAQLRIGGRRQLQEGLLPGPGSRGAQPVPRHAQAPHLPRAGRRAVAAGQEVFAASDAEQPVGTVVQAAAAPDGGWAALMSMQISALEAGPLHAGRPTARRSPSKPLPYALLEDI
jgi:hypothetical protein